MQDYSLTLLFKRALAHVAIGNSGGVGQALVGPRTASRVVDGGAGGGRLAGTGRASNNRGLGTGRATVPWTVRKGTRRATIPLRIVWKGTRGATIPPCRCDSRAPVGPRRRDGHGVRHWMVGDVIMCRSTPTPPPVRFRTLELPHSPQIRRPATPMSLPPEE